MYVVVNPQEPGVGTATYSIAGVNLLGRDDVLETLTTRKSVHFLMI